MIEHSPPNSKETLSQTITNKSVDIAPLLGGIDIIKADGVNIECPKDNDPSDYVCQSTVQKTNEISTPFLSALPDIPIKNVNDSGGLPDNDIDSATVLAKRSDLEIEPIPNPDINTVTNVDAVKTIIFSENP